MSEPMISMTSALRAILEGMESRQASRLEDLSREGIPAQTLKYEGSYSLSSPLRARLDKKLLSDAVQWSRKFGGYIDIASPPAVSDVNGIRYLTFSLTFYDQSDLSDAMSATYAIRRVVTENSLLENITRKESALLWKMCGNESPVVALTEMLRTMVLSKNPIPEDYRFSASRWAVESLGKMDEKEVKDFLREKLEKLISGKKP